MNVCPTLASATDSSKQKPRKKISYTTKTQIPKKIRINIITIISNPSIKSSIMVIAKFHNMNRKKILMSPLNSNKLKKFHFTTSQNNVIITVQKCSVFFSSFFQSMYCLFKKKNVRSFFLFFFFSYVAFNNIQVSFLSFFFFFYS